MEFKNAKARDTYEQLDSRLKDAAYEISVWCRCRLLPFVITRCIDDMIPNVSKTNIHADKRAFDMSVHGWTADEVDEFIHDMNERFSNSIGAFSLTDNKPRFVVYHNAGMGMHFHCQVRK
jgi:hypothetical protein